MATLSVKTKLDVPDLKTLVVGGPIEVYQPDRYRNIDRSIGQVTMYAPSEHKRSLVTLTTVYGASVTLTDNSAVVVYSGRPMIPERCVSNLVAVMLPNGEFRWERVDAILRSPLDYVTTVECSGYYVAGNDPKLGLILVS